MSGQAAHIIVRGRVQGVFFRVSTQSVADDLRLAGWVRNCADGSVEIHAEGDAQAVDRLIEWCRQGPPSASVSGVDVEWVAVRGMKDFRVR
ncbi:MAG: acylphosphatase [Nitrospinales bacterium]